MCVLKKIYLRWKKDEKSSIKFQSGNVLGLCRLMNAQINDCVDDWHLAKLLPTSKHGGLNITIMPNGWLIQGLIGD
jgi:hypothetical protein